MLCTETKPRKKKNVHIMPLHLTLVFCRLSKLAFAIDHRPHVKMIFVIPNGFTFFFTQIRLKKLNLHQAPVYVRYMS